MRVSLRLPNNHTTPMGGNSCFPLGSGLLLRDLRAPFSCPTRAARFKASPWPSAYSRHVRILTVWEEASVRESWWIFHSLTSLSGPTEIKSVAPTTINVHLIKDCQVSMEEPPAISSVPPEMIPVCGDHVCPVLAKVKDCPPLTPQNNLLNVLVEFQELVPEASPKYNSFPLLGHGDYFYQC